MIQPINKSINYKGGYLISDPSPKSTNLHHYSIKQASNIAEALDYSLHLKQTNNIIESLTIFFQLFIFNLTSIRPSYFIIVMSDQAIQQAPVLPETKEVVEQPSTDPRKLFVSNLDITVSNRKTESDLNQIFSQFGQILSISVKRNDRQKRLFAFVLFKNAEDAARAIDDLDDSYFGDSKIRVELQNNFRGAAVAGNNSAVTCYRCKQTGHIARDCKQKPAYQQERSKRPQNEKERQTQNKHHHQRRRSRDRKKRESSSSSSSSSSRNDNRRKRRQNRSSSSSRSSSAS